MTSRTRSLAVVAVLGGIAGDVLLRGGMWRFGFTLWLVSLIVVAVIIGQRHTGNRLFLFAGLAFAAMGLSWRDAPVLYAIDLLSVLCVGALLVWHGTGMQLAQLTVVESVRAAALAVVNALGGALGMLQPLLPSRERVNPEGTRGRALALGVVLAIPPLFIVTNLLISADAIFDSTMQRLVDFLTVYGLQHVLVALLLTWVVAGLLKGALGGAIHGLVPDDRPISAPFAVVGVALYALAGMLALFVATQARVLFGGEAFLMATAHLTVAAYAREGFFQLVAASGVVLGTLVLADWLVGTQDRESHRKLRVVGAILLTLILALLSSAATRIWLYVSQFGLSIDRLVACTGIGFVFAVVLTTAATILRGRSDRFAPTTLGVTIAWVALLNIVNLEAIVVRTNVARARMGAAFDATYHAGLSADALPVLVEEAASLMPVDCQALSDALQTAWTKRLNDSANGGIDWRSRNLPLVRARAWFAGGPLKCAGTTVAPTAIR